QPDCMPGVPKPEHHAASSGFETRAGRRIPEPDGSGCALHHWPRTLPGRRAAPRLQIAEPVADPDGAERDCSSLSQNCGREREAVTRLRQPRDCHWLSEMMRGPET